MTSRLKRCVLVVAAISLGSVVQVSADAITFNYTARVTLVQDAALLAGVPVSVGDVLSGSFTFDPNARDLELRSNEGRYVSHGAPYGIGLNVGSGFRFDSVSITVLDGPSHPFGFLDVYDARWSEPLPGFTDVNLGFGIGLDPSIFTSDALPRDPPDLTKREGFNAIRFFFSGTRLGGGQVAIFGDPLSLTLGQTPAPTPEPGTLFLLGTAALALARGWRKHRGTA